MTIEVRNTLLGIPLSTFDKSYDRDMFLLRREKLIDHNSHTIVFTYACRVLSPDEIAVYKYTPEVPPYSIAHTRREPQILTREEINKAKLHTNGVIIRTQLHWKPTR
jgi:hypothetical protein